MACTPSLHSIDVSVSKCSDESCLNESFEAKQTCATLDLQIISLSHTFLFVIEISHHKNANQNDDSRNNETYGEF